MTGATKRRKKKKNKQITKRRLGYRGERKNTYNKEGKVGEFL